MEREIKDERRRALEEEFFAKLNRELTAKLKAEGTRAEACKELAAVSGIKDDKVLQGLYDAGVTAATMSALSLVPLILVAWADGSIDQKERDAILRAAKAQGLEAEHPAYQHLTAWMEQKPQDQLFDTWKVYVRGLSSTLGADSFNKLRIEIMNRTRAVATAAGGFLGLSSKVSASESAVIDELDKVFLAVP